MTASLLDQVVHDLEKSPNALRIKKLIFFVCCHTWENDPTVLQTLNLSQLLQQLLATLPTLAQLQATLIEFVETLNKKVEYEVIAKELIQALQPLYQTPKAQATAVAPLPGVVHSTEPMIAAPMAVESGTVKPLQVPALNDLFDVRLEVMRYTTPLRAKVLLFSLLEHPFNSSRQDWLSLKRLTLDDWLGQLLDIYQNFAQLEVDLHRTAKLLQPPDPYTQSAKVILKAIQPLYRFQQTEISVLRSVQSSVPSVHPTR